VRISNSILEGNIDHKIFLVNSSMSLLYTDLTGGNSAIQVQGGATVNWLEGNIDEDPMFDQGGEYPFALSPGSPCIDAGVPDSIGQNFPFWDLIGNYRLWDGDGDGVARVDMGAYEFGSAGVSVDEFKVQNSKFKIVCYPNPFSSFTTFKYSLEKESFVILRVFNSIGEEVASVFNGSQGKGEHLVMWDGSFLPSGMYFYELRAQKLGLRAQGKIMKL
jgi:hypothetical protein